MSVLIDLTPLNPSLPMLNINITSTFVSVWSAQPPSCRLSHLIQSLRVASRRTGRFKLPGRFIMSWFVSIPSRNFYHGWFVAYACAVYRVPRWWFRAGRGGMRGEISVKCQFARDILNFCENSKCGALAMIYMNRLSRLGGPDVL